MIDNVLAAHVFDIAIDHHGLRVLKMYLHCRQTADLSSLCHATIPLTLQLVENSYGNYYIQALLDACGPTWRAAVKEQMRNSFVMLSQSKFSSNVVEKCLVQSHISWKRVIIHELIHPSVVKAVITDRYSNYVCQTAVTVADNGLLNDIDMAVQPHLNTLRENVRKKWKTLLLQAKHQHQHDPPGETQSTDEPVSPPPIDHHNSDWGNTKSLARISNGYESPSLAMRRVQNSGSHQNSPRPLQQFTDRGSPSQHIRTISPANIPSLSHGGSFSPRGFD